MCQTIQVKRHFRLSCDRLQSISSCNGTLWCCKFNSVNTWGTRESWWWKLNHLRLSFSPGSRDNIMEVWRNGSVKHRLNLPEQQRGSTTSFSSVLLLPEVPPPPISVSILVLLLHLIVDFFFLIFPVCVCQSEELWSACVDSGEVCIWHIKDTSKPFHRVALPDCTGCYCMIKVKNQVNTQHKETHT